MISKARSHDRDRGTAGLPRRLTLVPLSAGHADEMAAVPADPDLYTFTGGTPATRQELRASYERWTAGSPPRRVLGATA